jgi:hypothetical protein
MPQFNLFIHSQETGSDNIQSRRRLVWASVEVQSSCLTELPLTHGALFKRGATEAKHAQWTASRACDLPCRRREAILDLKCRRRRQNSAHRIA